MLSCDILPKHVSDLLPHWRELINQLSVPDQIAQLEFAIGEGKKFGTLSTVFVLRHMVPLGQGDQQLLREFAKNIT